MIDLSSCERHM